MILFACSFSTFAWCKENAKVLLESTSPVELECLSRFINAFFVEDDFSYTLFGDKPMSFSGIDRSSHSPSINFRRTLEVFKKIRSNFLNKNYLFVLNEDSDGALVYFINRSAFIKTIENNIDVFKKELGNITAESFLEEIADEKNPLLDLIHHHEGILGILLGYGTHNAMLFQKKADLLGRCWAYGDQVKQNTLDATLIQEELADLDSKLGSFSQEHEYRAKLPVAPLGFAADVGHPETKQLKKKYRALRKKINKLFLRNDPLVIIMQVLMDDLIE